MFIKSLNKTNFKKPLNDNKWVGLIKPACDDDEDDKYIKCS